MLLHIPGLFSREEVQRIRQALEAADWADGKITAGYQSAKAKHNLQLPEGHPLAKEIGAAMLERLWQNPLFMSAALPHKVFPPLLNCYTAGGSFDFHIDNAVRQPKGSQERVRTDLSSTLFFSDPEEYDGGELEIQDTFGLQRVKLPAGDMVLYPRFQPAQSQRRDPWRALRLVFLDPKPGARRQPAHLAVRDGRRDPATERGCPRPPGVDPAHRHLPQPVASLGRGLSMGFLLRREEVLNVEQLQRMLDDSPVRAAQAILIAAKQGVVDAQALLGQILLEGRGIERDEALALRWFQIAAQGGHLMARNMLGRCREHGWGCSADEAAAAREYQLAAEAGLDWGQYNYANLLATGRGVAEDQPHALRCYRQAAEQGHAKSMNLLGRYLEEGQFCPRDLDAAVAWYRRSAEAGDFRGQFSYAAVLADSGQIEAALAWLRKALAGGNLKFLRVAHQALVQAEHPRIRALAEGYRMRALELAGE